MLAQVTLPGKPKYRSDLHILLVNILFSQAFSGLSRRASTTIADHPIPIPPAHSILVGG